jgi:putative transposon-encoded protein
MQPPASPVTTIAGSPVTTVSGTPVTIVYSTVVTLYGNSTTLIANTNVPVTNVLANVVSLYGGSTTLITNTNVPVTNVLSTVVTLYGNSTTLITNPNVPVTTVQNGGSTPTTMVMNAAVSLTGNPTFSSVTVSGAVSTGTLNAAGNSTLAGIAGSSLTISGAVSTGTLNATGSSTLAAVSASGLTVSGAVSTGTLNAAGNSTLAGVVDSAALSVSGASSLVGNQFINGVETTLLPFANAVFWSPDMSRTNTTFNPASATAYFVYIGEVMSAFTPKYVRFYQSTAGTLSVNEVGIFSSTSAPDAANQTLTKITSGTFTAGTGVIKNGSAFSTALTVGQHIWVGFNSTWSVQPVLNGLADDYATGSYLTVASPTAFASGTSYSGVFVSTMSALTGVCPDLVLTNN